MTRTPQHWLVAALLMTLAAARIARAGDWENFPNGREPLYRGVHRLAATYSNGLASSFGFGDSTYIGYTPGAVSAANPWGITASTTSSGTTNVHRPPAPGCMWTWDNASAFGETGANGFPNGDSLQGWWPIRLQWRYLLDVNQPDYNMPANALDFGNLTNYYPVHGRTTGVVGVWHRDQGGDVTGTGNALHGEASNGVTWVPLQGQYSAWCGLRAHGDATAPKDGITGNPFDADAAIWNVHVRYTASTATPKFPGYVDQWDQMLYRDIDMSSHTDNGLTLEFMYSTRMSVAADLCGWFDKDPLSPTSSFAGINCATGNYISNWDLANTGPVDSFMVYVGQPTEGTFQQFNGCGDSNGRAAIYDPLRRWFDEVVEANDPGKVIQLISAAGDDSNHVIAGFTAISLSSGQLSPILTASSGKVRLVFRVKTNSQVSDVTNGAYNSRGRGAAQVDDVKFTMTPSGATSPAGWGDFEAAGSIDNTRNAVDAWRSTGKPPSIQTHLARLNDANDPYTDLCGSDPTLAGRVCSMAGGIITFGRSSDGRIGDPTPYQSDRESSNGIMSPTIQLRSNNGSWPNTIGIKAPGLPGDAIASSDAMVDYETYAQNATDGAPPIATGITYRWLVQSFPQLTGGNAPGAKQWGNIIRSFANYQTDRICFRSLSGITGQEGALLSLGMYQYSKGAAENENYPDSVRIGWNCESTCWSTGVNACNPIGGVYIDNVSLVIVDGNPLPLSAEIWNWWQTSFPWNEDVAPMFAASFDTAAILVKSGLDIGPADGLNSFDVPGDSIVCSASGTAPMRVDLVFRILPGPGNYRIVGNSGSGLTTNPSAGTPTTGVGRNAVTTNLSSSNLFETFLANNGPFGTPGGHGGTWNPNVWNSARCDTTEINLFPRSVGPTAATSWMSTYHDIELGIGAGDAYAASTVVRSGIGLPRHKCFLASNTAQPSDIDCEHDPPASGSGYDLSWVTAAGSGYDGVPTTKEGTRIIPDGLLTPGAHVEYFWRKAEGGSTTMTGMLPDTNIVVPQLGERNNDGHRFAGFGALPDRWKQLGYTHPLGLSSGTPACMLVVNDQTANGYDWLAWTGVADSIGATNVAKRGAEVGWGNAPGNGADINNATYRVAAHLGNPGYTWDGYQIIGAEDTRPAGSFGARYAHSDASNTQINGKRQQGAPTLEQLKAFYKIILWFSGNLNALSMGPSGDRGSDDTQLIKDYLLSGSPGQPNRGFVAMGDGFVEANEREDIALGQHDLDLNYFGVELQSAQYRIASGNSQTTIDLVPPSGGPITDGTIYGLRNTCTHTNDVLGIGVGGVQSLTTVLANYADPNPSDAATYPANILKQWSTNKPWIAVTGAWSITDLMSRYGFSTQSRLRYFYKVFASLFGSICPLVACPPWVNCSGGVEADDVLSDFVSLRNNPVESGMARIHFGLVRRDRVEVRVYDVAGRAVRLLADRTFAEGEHDIFWDGADDAGQRVARGVYFTQVRYRATGFLAARKITLLH